jgi:hypothetical protein
MGNRNLTRRTINLDLPNNSGAVAIDKSSHLFIDTDNLDKDDVFIAVGDDDDDDDDDDIDDGMSETFGCSQPSSVPIISMSMSKVIPLRGRQRATIGDVQVLVPVPGILKR